MKIIVQQGDITTLDVDAIVNAANESLLGGGGVDGAIHRAAGPELLNACKKLNGCNTGDARITPGFRLPASYIIHTVGPVWHGGTQGEDEKLRQCYISCMRIAHENHIDVVAFPAISCGVYGFPPERAADIAVNSLASHTGNAYPQTVLLIGYDEKMTIILRKAVEKFYAKR